MLFMSGIRSENRLQFVPTLSVFGQFHRIEAMIKSLYLNIRMRSPSSSLRADSRSDLQASLVVIDMPCAH